jgi:hypothetical protein
MRSPVSFSNIRKVPLVVPLDGGVCASQRLLQTKGEGKRAGESGKRRIGEKDRSARDVVLRLFIVLLFLSDFLLLPFTPSPTPFLSRA